MCNAINAAMRAAMTEDEKAVVFGEDVGFGGVFRCTVNLLEEFKKERVFNTPLCEQVWRRMCRWWRWRGVTPINRGCAH